MDAAARIALIIVTAAVLVFIFIYWKLDKESYRMASLVREMEEDLRRWISAGRELVAAEPVWPEEAERCGSLLEELDGIKRGSYLEKVPVFNQIIPIIWSAALEKGDTFEGVRRVREMNAIREGLSGLVEAYDLCAAKQAERLESGLTGLVGRICRVKTPEQLEEMRIPDISD
ncbi:MAG: hypothetical protein K6C09_04330 [Oscillospiraceae bacterium]|nr:hypothetical protein [Oscillospiraceae bacterium]